MKLKSSYNEPCQRSDTTMHAKLKERQNI